MACAVVDKRGLALASGVVVTVHGLYGSLVPLLPTHACVAAQSTFKVSPFVYHPRRQSLRVSGQQLATYLRERKPHSSGDSIHFVTYDYGALVLREAFRYINWNDIPSKIVMIAPPNRGAQYFRTMREHVGVAGYGGVAADELASLSADDLDGRLGKLPRRCFPLVIAGSLCLNPFNQGSYPCDGLLTVDETTLPGEFRHQVLGGSHYTLPFLPSTMWYMTSFIHA